MKFREDINALRAIAVVAVVIFHFNHSWLPGGFAGVDVFFVISGFLMTMIIFKGLEKNTFSILRFYQARVRRILPALIALCFALLVFGYFLLSPLDYLILGKHAAASLTFTSNILYWTEAGYFNDDSIEKWLLHTWSLSVEWQFYLLYPLLLALLKKLLSLEHIKITLLITTVLALLVSIVSTFESSAAAYFLLPTRAWQMLVGGLVFLYPITLSSKTKTGTQLLGVFCIGLSLFIFSEQTPWPGYASILPILGACLVLVANKSDTYWVTNKVTHLLGKWSYSIYLCHWPIVVAGYYFGGGENWWLIGIPASIIIGAISYTLVESKSLSDYRLSKLKYLLKPLPSAGIVTALSLVVFLTNGMANRLPAAQRVLVNTTVQPENNWVYPPANVNIESLRVRKIVGRTDKNVLVLGASHAAQIYPYVKNIHSPYNVYFLTQGGCLVTPSMQNPSKTCSNIHNYQDLLDTMHFEKIVTTFYTFDNYLSTDKKERARKISMRIEEYDIFLNKIKAHTNHVYLILGEPKGMEFEPKFALRWDLASFITVKQAKKNYEVHQQALAQLNNLDNIKIIDPIKFLCGSGICETRNATQGFFYSDDNHMRPWYAIEKLRYLDEIFLDTKQIDKQKNDD
jgi:peptidoglycan/LPS O-acetylase OafA/YrhL